MSWWWDRETEHLIEQVSQEFAEEFEKCRYGWFREKIEKMLMEKLEELKEIIKEVVEEECAEKFGWSRDVCSIYAKRVADSVRLQNLYIGIEPRENPKEAMERVLERLPEYMDDIDM